MGVEYDLSAAVSSAKMSHSSAKMGIASFAALSANRDVDPATGQLVGAQGDHQRVADWQWACMRRALVTYGGMSLKQMFRFRVNILKTYSKDDSYV